MQIHKEGKTSTQISEKGLRLHFVTQWGLMPLLAG